MGGEGLEIDQKIAMADGSEPNAPEGFPQDTPSTQEGGPSGEVRRCTSCGGPVKGHFGSCRTAKCIFGLLNKSARRIDALETELVTCKNDYDQLEKFSVQRQDGLLATISALQEEVQEI